MTSSIWQTAAATCIVAALAGAGSTVNAQTTGTTGTTGATGSLRGTNATSSTSSTVTTTSGLPQPSAANAAPQESADAIVQRASNLSQRVAQMLDEARRDADMIRVTCLNDKLTQINANLRTAQGRLASLQKAVDVDQRNHELTVLTVLGQKMQVLDQESNQCVGQDLYETGPTKVTTEINTSLLPFEADPTNPQIQIPTAPSTLGVMDASSNGVPP
jgi:hypothetical protein